MSTLTTKQRIKDRLQLNQTVTTFDGLIDSLILAVGARIEQMCAREFTADTHTNELYDGSDIYGTRQSNLILKNSPVTSISSFQYKTGLNSDPDWFDFSADDYDIDQSAGLIYMSGNLPSGKQNIRLTYVAGYEIDFTDSTSSPQSVGAGHTLPYDLTEVCEEVVCRLFKRRDSEGRTQESFQESSITWSENVFSKENLVTINNYRRAVL